MWGTVRGKISQAEIGLYPGTQCTSMATAACVMASMKPVCMWDPNDVDRVIHFGNRLHEESIHTYQQRFNAPPPSHKYLCVDEVVRSGSFDGRAFSFDLDEGDIPLGGFFTQENVARAIERFLKSNKGGVQERVGVLTCNNRSIAILSSSRRPCIMDSHASVGGGKAMLGSYLEPQSCAMAVKSILHDPNASEIFTLIPIVATVARPARPNVTPISRVGPPTSHLMSVLNVADKTRQAIAAVVSPTRPNGMPTSRVAPPMSHFKAVPNATEMTRQAIAIVAPNEAEMTGPSRQTKRNETEERRAQRLARTRARRASAKMNESQSSRADRLEKGRKQKSLSRLSESKTDRAKRLQAAREHNLNLSEADKAAHLEKDRQRKSLVRANLPEADKAAHIEKVRQRNSLVRDNLSEADKAAHLEKDRQRKSLVRANLSEADKAAHLEKERQHISSIRASQREKESDNSRSVRLMKKRQREHVERDRRALADAALQSLAVDNDCGGVPPTRAVNDSGDQRHNEIDILGKLFEDFQLNFDWADCSRCLERFPGIKSKAGVCSRCDKIGEGRINSFSAENYMDPGELPNELIGLSMVEEQLIAMVHPVLSVYRIRGQQYGYSGQVINFPQKVADFAKKLPWSVSTLSSVLIVRREQGTGYVDFRVRKYRVKAALEFLIQHNRYYRDIVIDEAVLGTLPEDGSVLDLEPQILPEANVREEEVEDEEVVTTDVPNLAIVEQARQIQSALGDPTSEAIAWPELATEPINEFSTVGYIAMAFPTLFPLGNADLREPRQVRVTPSEYFQHLIKYKDGRFARHPRFRFFAMNSSLRWAALQNGKVCIDKNSELKNLNAEGVREKLANNPNLMRNILCFNSSLRGTSAYWHARCGELLDLVQESGPPTLFFTLSAADIHWPDIARLLAPEVEFDQLGKSEGNRLRNSLVNDNPVIVAWYFVNRADFFIKSVLVPKFSVKQFWYRYEYQHRGSPHIHGVLWLAEAPDVRDLDRMGEEARVAAANFFGELISTMHPGTRPFPPVHPCQVRFSQVSDHSEDFCNLISCVQMHTKHGAQCMRVNKKTGVQECRFKFPFPLVDQTHLTKDSGHWELVTERNHPLVNRHNRFITEHWRANTDIQGILSVNAVLNYIAKYASKAEPRSKTLENLLSEALKKDDDSAQTVVQKLFVKMVAERDFSAQETAQILMGWPLYHCSRSFIVVNVDEKQWVRIGNTEVDAGKSAVDMYPMRPENHEDIPLIEHAGKFYKKGQAWVTRRTPSVVRVFPKRRRDQGEVYFRQQVLLHVPWRSIEEFQSQGTWEQIYFLRVGSAATEGLVVPRVEDEYEDAEENDEDLNVEEEWMVAARMGPNGEIGPEVEMGMREIDRNFAWGDAYEQYSEPLNLPGFISMEKASCNSRDDIWEDPQVTFSEEQQRVLDYLEQRIEAVKQGADDTEASDPNMMIIQGKAGSGKSTVIKAMCAKLNRELGPNSFRLMAPTGAAAVNVGGCTIHSGLHLGIEKVYRKMGDENLNRFQEDMAGCSFIIIDEMSMVGCSLLKKIDLRCREAKPQFSNAPFGGMTLFLLGDIKQLPPVLDRPFYGSGYTGMLADQGQLLYKSIRHCIVLSASYRQGGEDQAVFRDILDRLSMGKSTKSDWEMLMTREMSRLSGRELSLFRDCMRLFPENKSVTGYNFEKLKSLHRPTAKVPAEHNNKQAAQASADQQAQGLEKTLYLCQGARVMLRTNLWVDKGLVNGSIGTVTNLVYAPNSSPPGDRPLVVMVDFDSYTGPTVAGSVPIAAVTRTWRSGEVSCSRTQFPILLAWAVTIHKSQGLTLPRVVVDIGTRELAAGCSYVALSRSRRLVDLVLQPFNLDRLIRIGTMKLLLMRVDEERRLNGISSTQTINK